LHEAKQLLELLWMRALSYLVFEKDLREC